MQRQADLGRVLVGIRQWRRDAHGALADIAQEQAAARCAQRVLDAQLDGADKRQQEEVRCVWLCAGMLGERGWHCPLEAVAGCWARPIGLCLPLVHVRRVERRRPAQRPTCLPARHHDPLQLCEEMERQVVVEVRLEELGARLRFLFEMVRALHRLDKHICRHKVQ